MENTHSILRANTSPNDSASELTKKAKMLFQSKANLHNFSSVYTPPKSFTFSQNQLKYLKLQTAKLLVRVFKFISGKTQESDSLDPHLPTDDIRAFPLAYRTCRTPNPNLRCDLPGYWSVAVLTVTVHSSFFPIFDFFFLNMLLSALNSIC